MAERWVAIPGEPGYEASDMGRIRSLDRAVQSKSGVVKNLRGRVLKLYQRRVDGYVEVSLNRQRNRYVHQVILESFVGPRPGSVDAMHINGDPGDNRLENLRWGSRRENILDVVRHGRHFSARKTHCLRGHALELPNLQPAKLRTGSRGCLACSRAKGELKLYPERDLLQVSNKHYGKIMIGREDGSEN